MKNAVRSIWLYIRRIIAKWALQVSAIVGIVGFVIQLLIPAIPLPQWVYPLIALIGFFVASYQVYLDVAGALPSQPPKPLPYELLPISFEIVCNTEIPWIGMYLYAVNHQSKELVLQPFDVTSFHLSGGPSLGKISLEHEYCIPPKQSNSVFCRRDLLDAEVRAIKRARRENPINATFSVTAHALAGRKSLSYKNPSLSASGWISGVPIPPNE